MKQILKAFQHEALMDQTRRNFLKDCGAGIGAMALSSLLGFSGNSQVAGATQEDVINPLAPKAPHFKGRAKNVIFIHCAGAPSQLEMFDYKPDLAKLDGKPCPDSFLAGKKFAFIQGVPDMLGPQAKFKQCGQSGIWLSDNIPHLSEVVDDLCIVKTMNSDQFNHAPAQFLLHSGSAQMGRPSFGAWSTYGLGAENSDLPGYVVLVSGGKNPSAGKGVWGSGFLPSVFQGVQCRSKGEPVLFSDNPAGMQRKSRKRTIDAITKINQEKYEQSQDPETLTRIAQYELAYRMQMSVPEATEIKDEPDYIHEMYGTEPGKESMANNMLLARRLVERGVRFVQIYDSGWDAHGTNADTDLTLGFKTKCKQMDRPCAALIKDLKQRGMLDDTLVVWCSEFGRTPMRENRGGVTMPNIGRDHHNACYTMWMAGGGVKAGHVHGETDAVGYYPVKDKVHVHDLQATMLHLLGFDHEKLTYPYQGRDFRLTDVHGHVVHDLFA